MIKSTVVVASLMLFAGARLSVADPVPLRLNLNAGQTWTFGSDQTMDSDNHASFNGQQQPFKTTSAQHRAGKVEVVAVKNGVPSSMRVTFDQSCKNSGGMGGQEQESPFAYAGKTVTVTRGEDGAITDDFKDQVDPDTMSELHSILDQNLAIFPKGPVDIGTEWPGDLGAVARLLQLQGDDHAGMTMKLLAVHNDGGRQVADVKVSMAAIKTVNGLSVKLISQGTANVDLATGRTMKLDMKGTTEMHGTQTGPGPDGNQVQYQIDGTGTLTITNTSSSPSANDLPTNAGNAPMAGGDPPMGNVHGGANPLGNGGNPLGGGGSNPLATSPYAGHFSDGKLTVDFTGTTDRLNGTLAMGGQVYPATAHGANSGIAGSFNAGGSNYNFTGSLDGETLSIVSDGTTYSLKKASTNPLAAPH